MPPNQDQGRSPALQPESSIFLLDEQGKLCEADGRTCYLLGRPWDTLASARLEDFFYPGLDIEGLAALLPGQTIRLQAQVTHPDGKSTPVEIRLEKLPSGKSLGVLQMPQAQDRVLTSPAEDAGGLGEAGLDTGTQLLQVLDLEEILSRSLELAIRLVPCDGVNIALLEARRVIVRAARGYEAWTAPALVRQLTWPLEANSAFREVLRTRESVLIPDTSAIPGWAPVPGLERVRNWLGFPLQAAGQIFGVLSVDKLEPGYFTPSHRQVLQALADLVALMMHTARLFEVERRLRREAEALREAAAGLRFGLNLTQLLDEVLVHLERLLPFDRAQVLLQEAGSLRVAAARGFTALDPAIGRLLPDSHPIIGELRRKRRPLTLVDARTDVRLQAWALPSGRGWMGVPLEGRGEFLGCLVLVSEQAGFYNQAHANLAQAFADQAAVAIQDARLFEQVRSGRERLKALSQRLVAVQESERRHIARELHDQIGQLLTGLKLILEMSAHPPQSPEPADLAEAQQLVDELMKRVRELSLDLRPAMLDDLGLLPSLLWLFERYSNQTRVQVDFKHLGVEDRRFTPEIETAAYRIVQEALTNVARHAGVDRAAVRLWTDENRLCLQVEDRGHGFDPELVQATGAYSGISGMHERGVLLGGQLLVESRPGEGTLVTAELPFGGFLERRHIHR